MARLRCVFKDFSGFHRPICSLTAENDSGQWQISFSADVAIIDVLERLLHEVKCIDYKSRDAKIVVTGQDAIKVALRLLVKNEYIGDSLRRDTLKNFPTFTPKLFKNCTASVGEDSPSSRAGFVFKY